jgi:chromosome segregation ATPase
LNAWQTSKNTATADRQTVIPDSVQAAFGAAWRLATQEAGKEVLAIRQQAADEVQSIKTTFDEALHTIERLEGEVELEAARNDTLAARVAEVEALLHRLENERAALMATVEQQKNQLRSQEGALERAHQSSEDERKRHEAEMRDSQVKANVLLEELRQQLAHSKGTMEKAEAQAESARKEMETAIKEAAELRGRAQALEGQTKELLARLPGKPEERSEKQSKGR